jgi:TonB family protein
MSAPLLRRRLIAALTGAALTAVVIVLLFPLRIPAQAIAPGIERAASAFKVISMGPVIYPSSEDKGELNIEVTVNEKGEVTDARVLSGPEALRSAALRNVLSWKFATQPPLPPRFEVGLRFNERPKAAKSSESALINGSISRTQVVKKVLPKYPLAAKSAGVQGVVKLRVTINTEGLPKMVEVVSGPVELVEAARDAVLLWEWKPFEKEGARVEVITDVDINFTLADKAPAPPPPAN